MLCKEFNLSLFFYLYISLNEVFWLLQVIQWLCIVVVSKQLSSKFIKFVSVFDLNISIYSSGKLDLINLKTICNLRGITDRLSLDIGATEWIDLHASIITHNSHIVILIWNNYFIYLLYIFYTSIFCIILKYKATSSFHILQVFSIKLLARHKLAFALYSNFHDVS